MLDGIVVAKVGHLVVSLETQGCRGIINQLLDKHPTITSRRFYFGEWGPWRNDGGSQPVFYRGFSILEEAVDKTDVATMDD